MSWHNTSEYFDHGDCISLNLRMADRVITMKI